MPPAPIVSVLLPMRTLPVGRQTVRPEMPRSPPRTVPRLASELVSKRIASPPTGAMPPTQLSPVPQAVLLLPSHSTASANGAADANANPSPSIRIVFIRSHPPASLPSCA